MIMRFLETPNQLAGLGYYNTITEAQLAVIYPEQIQSFPKTSKFGVSHHTSMLLQC